jgi:glycosyltransferase involved in cell wall biosynthesis
MHIAHMTMPLARDGSAVTNVVRSLVQSHSGKSTVITSKGRDVEVAGAENIRADFSGCCPREYFDRFEMFVDHCFGFLDRERPFTGQLPLAGIHTLRESNPDVVFVHEGHYACSALPLFRRWLPDSKLFVYVHTRPSRCYSRRELRRLLSCVDGVVCVSEYIEKMVRARVGTSWNGTPIHSVVNGVDTARFFPSPELMPAHRALFVGQVSKHKGADLAVKAVGAVRDPMTLRVVGSSVHGPTKELTRYERRLRTLAAAVENGRRISFEPFRSNHELPEVYRAAGVLLIPSRFNDPCPLVCLEALASGCAVIGSTRGGIPAICGDAGLVVDPTERNLALAMEGLIKDPAMYAELRSRARQRACDLQWSKQFRKLMDFVASAN